MNSKPPDPGGGQGGHSTTTTNTASTAPTTTIEDLYDVIEEVGKGGYGSVFKAKDKKTGEIVALKRVRTFDPRQATPPSFFRETECLRQMNKQSDEHILNMKKIVRCSRDNVFYLVLEYCDLDLSDLIRFLSCLNPKKRTISSDQIKIYMKQILLGIQSLHRNGYVHRDIKPANILFQKRTNSVKIADFGLTRNINQNFKNMRPLTPRVATPSYRSPELLLGSRNYDYSIDIWSLGCLFFEMVTGKVLFHTSMSSKGVSANPINSDFQQLNTVFKIIGSPTENDWPNPPNKELIMTLPFYCNSLLDEILDSTLPFEYIGLKSLLKIMLTLNPAKRITVDGALNHPFIANINADLRPIEIDHNIDLSHISSYSSLDEPTEIVNFVINNNDNNDSVIITNQQINKSIKLIGDEKYGINNKSIQNNSKMLSKLRPAKVTPPEIGLF